MTLRKAFDGEAYYWYEDAKSRQAKSRVTATSFERSHAPNSEAGRDVMGNEKAPERIWIDAAPHLIGDATRHIYVEPPPPHFRDFNSVEYVRADLLATVRAEEQSRFVNNVAAVLDADDVEAFTALIMKAKASPDLNSETRSALRSEAEIRAEEKEAMLNAVREFFSGLTSKQVNLDDLLSALTENEKGEG